VAWRFYNSSGVAKTGEYGELATPGIVVQMVNTQTGAVATGTTILPYDNTIPQITEGDQYMTLGITPKHADNILTIVVHGSWSTRVDNETLSVALFVGTTANALAAVAYYESGIDVLGPVSFQHRVVAGVTSALTFRVRAGAYGAGTGAGTTTFNGDNALRKLGGVCSSSITITESTP